MSSPFPGMDPFLENPEIFPDIHDRLVIYLADACQPVLPEPYYSAIGRRAWIEVSERPVEPDVNVVRAQWPEPPAGAGSGAVAVAEDTATEPVVIHVPHDEHREPFVEIYVGQGKDRRLVTLIEVLSPSNKHPGEHGRNLYLRKQREILGSQVHLIEIDLLRGGTHTTAVPLDRLRRRVVEYDYHVCLHRFDQLEDYVVYPFRLSQRLPRIEVPLLPGDGSISLDLQAVFDRCYDAGPYRREINYRTVSPVPPLSDEQAAWVAARLDKHFAPAE